MRRTVKTSDRGAVLLTTLLIMGVMAALAVAIVDDMRFAIKRAGNVQSYAQADWYVAGAEDFAETYIQSQILSLNSAALNAGLAQTVPVVLPLDDGFLSLSVQDGSQCFSLGRLHYPEGQSQFKRLLVALEWTDQDAERLSHIATDWIDSDSQTRPGGAEDFAYLDQTPASRTANTDFRSVQELRALDTMTEAKFQRVRPFVCSRDHEAGSAININTLPPHLLPLLASVLAVDNPVLLAEALLRDRPSGGYTDAEQLKASPALVDLETKNIGFDQIIFEPEYIWVEADIRVGNIARFGAYEFKIDGKNVTRTFRRLSDEAFRPRPRGKTPT